MIDLGTVRPGSTIRIPFSTFDKDDGSSITMTNYAAADILVYKDGSTTERASTSGYTATTDFDTKTGKHLAIIDLADNTTAGFWAAGSEYLVALDSVTVDAVTAGPWIARFRIGYANAVLDTTIATLSSQTSFTLTVGPAEDDALNGMWAVIHDIASAVQLSRVLILDYTGSTKTVTLATGATFTAAAGDNFSVMDMAPLQPTTTGRTLDVSTGGEGGVDWANIGSPTTTVNLSGTTVKTATDVETDTADIQTRLPAALVGGRMDANVGAISEDATAANNLEAILDGTGNTGLSLSSLVITAGVTITQSTTDTPGVSITGNGTGAGLYVEGPSANGFVVKGGTNSILLDMGTGDGIAGTPAPFHYLITGNISGNITSVTTATNLTNLPTMPTDWLTADGLKADAVNEIQSGLATASALTTVEGKIDTIDGIVDSILVDTAEIGVAGAGLTALAPAATALSTATWTGTRAGYLDKLNITGNVASSGEVTNVQNNTRMVFVVPEQIIRPSSGTTTNYVRLYLYDSVGNMEAPDSAPEMELRNVAGTDLSARLASTTGTEESTGVYRWSYTSDPAHALEQILWSVTVVEGGATRKNGRTSWIAETYTTDFTSSDRTTLNTIAGYVDSIPADVRTELATELARIDVATSTRLAASSYAAPLDAAGTRSAIGLASANLDTQLAALPTATENADALLARNHEGGSNGGRTVSQSFGAVRNKVAFDVPAAGQFTVYAADDSTPLYTGTYTATSGANPVTAIDPS